MQKFALRVIIKHWTYSYEELLSLTTLLTLNKELIFETPGAVSIVNDFCFSPHGIVTFRGPTHYNIHSSYPLSLAQSFARSRLITQQLFEEKAISMNWQKALS